MKLVNVDDFVKITYGKYDSETVFNAEHCRTNYYTENGDLVGYYEHWLTEESCVSETLYFITEGYYE